MAEAARKAKTTADPPFDFAQDRLFGDDRKKGNSKAIATAGGTGNGKGNDRGRSLQMIQNDSVAKVERKCDAD
jgi:hypothetical protein